MSRQKILFIVTSHDALGDRGKQTGFHLAEVTHPWSVLADAGFEIDFASPKGGKAPIDPGSLDKDDETNVRFLEDSNASQKIEHTSKVSEIAPDDYEAIYFPGGHGTMWDFPEAEVGKLAAQAYEAGKIVAAVCHGPAALVNASLKDGTPLVSGKTVSAFTDEEERAVELDSVVPFLLASRLKELGATHEKADNFKKSVSVDERLVTGQNPASAREVGEKILALVEKRQSDAA